MCIVIKAFTFGFEQLQCLNLAAGLVLLSQYFDGTCDCKAAAAPIKVGQILDPECIAFVRRQPIFVALNEVEES